jgi:hypothetical protein
VGAVAQIYASIDDGDRLFMGEILSNVVERQVVSGEASGDFEFREDPHPFAVIVSQDCDLEQDAHARGDAELDPRRKANALAPHVLLVVGSDVKAVIATFPSSRAAERVKLNKDERFQFLCNVPATADRAGSGVPALVLDFKRFFSFPTDELLRRIARGEIQRRARLTTPYAEHLSVRFGFSLQRVGLTKEHHDVDREVVTGPATQPFLGPSSGETPSTSG